jgi:hypothetical protein
LQAADVLAVEAHVQEVCRALATQLFGAEPSHCSKGVQEVTGQVLIHLCKMELQRMHVEFWELECTLTVESLLEQ